MGRAAILFVGLLTLASNAAAEELDFRLHDFDGVASLAASLRKSDFEVNDEAERLGLVVKGPTAPEQAQQPVLAQIKSRIEGIDITAGMQADRSMIREGPAQWIGGLGVASEYDLGRRSLELRTSVGQNDQWGAVGLEVGPRLERRLPGGILFVIDGKAEARTLPADPAIGSHSLPGQANDSGLGMIGLTGRTGLVR
jgi:hypothetical protein